MLVEMEEQIGWWGLVTSAVPGGQISEDQVNISVLMEFSACRTEDI